MINRPFEKARWIWRQGTTGKDEFCDFADTFLWAGDESAYYLYISADSNYTAYINGKLAAFGQYADYPDYKVYDRIDVTGWLHPGENRLAVVVWYYGIDSSTYRLGKPGLIYELKNSCGEILSASSGNTLSRKSRDYASGRCELISSQLGPTYHYDLNRYDGFIETKTDGFTESTEQTERSTELVRRPNRKLVLRERMSSTIILSRSFSYADGDGNSAVRMQKAEFGEEIAEKDREYCLTAGKQADGIVLIADIGRETSGFLDFDIEVPEATAMEVGYGEHLTDGRCRTAVRGFFCDIGLKAGRNVYLHTFRRFGCRYLQFFIHADRVKVHYLGLRPTEYPLTVKEYDCGNELRNRIYQVCENTLLQCLHEHYEDCPWREQALYTLDSRNQMLCGYYAFREFEAPRAALELITHGVRPDGLLNLCYPAGTDAPIPSYSCAFFLQMEEYIRYTGDISLAQKHYLLLQKLLDVFLSRMQDNGVIENFYGPYNGKYEYWNFYEWVPTLSGSFGEKERRLEAPLNAFVSLALSAISEISRSLGMETEWKEYGRLADTLNRHIAEVFYNPDARLFKTFAENEDGRYAVLTQALCLLCGAADTVDISRIVETLVHNGEDTDRQDPYVKELYGTSLSMNTFRFDALLKVDREKYKAVILDEIDRTYGYMLDRGATSFWETIKGEADFGGAGSLCHGWSALPIYYYEILN